MTDPVWIFQLLAVVSVSGVVAGFFGTTVAKTPAWRPGTTATTPATNELVWELDTVCPSIDSLKPLA